VSEDVTAFHGRHQTVHQMKVRTADCATRHFDDYVATILDCWIGTLSQRMSFLPCQQSAFIYFASVISTSLKLQAGRESGALDVS
jgi:hypothetical protein